MSRKIKLSIASLGFLGANGIVLPSLNSLESLNIFNNLNWGGGQRDLLKIKKEKNKEQDLKLDSQNKKSNTELDFLNSNTKLQETYLELEGQNKPLINFQISYTQPQIQENISSNISNVFSEVEKEDKIEQLKRKADESYSTSAQKYFGPNFARQAPHLANFFEAKQSVLRWTRSRTTEKQDEQTAPDLNQAQRKSLQELYKLHSELKQKQNNLSTQLKKINSQEGEGEENKDITSTDPILKALSRIWWDKGKTRVTGEGSPYTQKWDYKTWRGWQNNPYKNFYDTENEFIKDFQKLNSLRELLYKGRKSLQASVNGAPRNWKEGFRVQEREIKTRIDNNYSYRHIEAKVAEKLLLEMGQLD